MSQWENTIGLQIIIQLILIMSTLCLLAMIIKIQNQHWMLYIEMMPASDDINKEQVDINMKYNGITSNNYDSNI
jgi:hypothetical protein